MSGGRDGCIHVWDTRCAKRGSLHRPVNSITGAHKRPQSTKRKLKIGSDGMLPMCVRDGKNSVTAVLFHGNQTIASCGAADG